VLREVALEPDPATIAARSPELAAAMSRAAPWTVLDVEVVRVADQTVVGSYRRTYAALFDTFCAFRMGGRDLALFSPDYTVTRVMELPSCTDIGGEERSARGFWPTDYFVPLTSDHEPACPYAFVSGLYAGDNDSRPWQIQVIDLEQIGDGVVKRDARFGYVELPYELRLHEAITVYKEPMFFTEEDPARPEWSVTIAAVRRFKLDTGAPFDRHGHPEHQEE
jgi:hypothetical protein